MNSYEALKCRMSGRSWWEAMYANGDTLAEWDTLQHTLLSPFGKGATSRWDEVSKHQMVRLRLICPNGQIGELVDPSREGYHFFQLKVGVRYVGRDQSFCKAHLIGLVLNPNGDCICRAWEPDSGHLTEFTDNVFALTYKHIGPLSLELQGLRV